jgi:hypothetical protein
MQLRRLSSGQEIKTDAKEFTMNWVFETYSNVYSTAMMQDTKTIRHAASAKSSSSSKLRGAVARFFGRA